jgi:hypothetical protein
MIIIMYVLAMRYSAKHKANTHSQLLKKATEQSRERGVQATGIAKLMNRAGMTHGGFETPQLPAGLGYEVSGMIEKLGPRRARFQN